LSRQTSHAIAATALCRGADHPKLDGTSEAKLIATWSGRAWLSVLRSGTKWGQHVGILQPGRHWTGTSRVGRPRPDRGGGLHGDFARPQL